MTSPTEHLLSGTNGNTAPLCAWGGQRSEVDPGHGWRAQAAPRRLGQPLTLTQMLRMWPPCEMCSHTGAKAFVWFAMSTPVWSIRLLISTIIRADVAGISLKMSFQNNYIQLEQAEKHFRQKFLFYSPIRSFSLLGFCFYRIIIITTIHISLRLWGPLRAAACELASVIALGSVSISGALQQTSC